MNTGRAYTGGGHWRTLPAMPAAPTDADLMLRYQRGDSAAFDTLYARHKGALFRYFARQTPARATAEELFQDMWMRLVRQRERWAPDAPFTAYLYTIAHSCLADYWRKVQRRPGDYAGDDPDDHALAAAAHQGTEARAGAMEIADRINAALATLPPEQAEAFVLREEGGLSLAEIAEVTGVGPETAKSRLRYAVSRLRQCLDEESA